jgi:hypothetical protein
VQRISARVSLRQVRPRELVSLGQALQKALRIQPLIPIEMTTWAAERSAKVKEELVQQARDTQQSALSPSLPRSGRWE